jgi:formate dehydrogenase assembly factor FdhD
MSEADIAQIEADTAMASAEFGRGMAQANRVIVNAAVDIAKIDIQDMTQNCTAGQYLSTDVKSLDGTRKARVRRVTCGEPCDVCGKRQAKIAMVKALTDLRAARRDIVSATEMPKAVRKDVMEKLDNEIRELETQTDNIN